MDVSIGAWIYATDAVQYYIEHSQSKHWIGAASQKDYKQIQGAEAARQSRRINRFLTPPAKAGGSSAEFELEVLQTSFEILSKTVNASPAILLRACQD